MVATEYFPPKALENWNAVEKNPYVIGTFSWAGIDYLGEGGIGLARLKSNTGKKGMVLWAKVLSKRLCHHNGQYLIHIQAN